MRTATLFTLLSTLALLCIALAIFSGAYPLSLHQVIGLLFSPDSLLPQDQIVFWQIRLPRIVAAFTAVVDPVTGICWWWLGFG